MERNFSNHPENSPKVNGAPIRTVITCVAVLLVMNFMSTSCIFERPEGDYFYRTLWESSETPFEGLRIEFLCGGLVSVKADAAVGSYGTYQPDEMTASFSDLTLIYNDSIVVVDEGYKDGDSMTINWHYIDSSEPHSTLMHRLSAY